MKLFGFFKRRNFGVVVLAGLLFCGLQARADLPGLYISDGDNVDLFSGGSLNTNFITNVGNQFDSPGGLAYGPDGNLYVAGIDMAQVYTYNSTTGVLSGTFVPFGADPSQNVQGPAGMTFGPGGSLYIADVTSSNIHVYSSAGVSTATLTGAVMVQPVNVAFDSAGQLFAADANGVEEYNSGLGQFASYIPAVSGGGSYVLNNAAAVAFSSAGDLYVLDISGSSPGILKFTGTTFDERVVDFSLDDFSPSDLIIGPDGKLYVSGVNFDTSTGEVLDFNLDGSAESVYVSNMENPTFISFAIPEPSGTALMCCGAGLLLAMGIRRRLLPSFF